MSSGSLIYIIAGEPSGDALGAGLMQALKVKNPAVTFAGIGGEMMQKEGLASLFPYSDLSLMGLVEILPHLPRLFKRLRETVDDIARQKPGVVVTIDSPGFNFLLAKKLKANPATRNIKRVHYVAPSVWAYKPGRARKTAQLFDALLTLLPFEPPYFEKEGLTTAFVGHPVLWNTPKGDGNAFRLRHGIAADASVLLVLPGSRPGEVKRLLPIFLRAVAEMREYQIVILAGAQVREVIKDFLSHPAGRDLPGEALAQPGASAQDLAGDPVLTSFAGQKPRHGMTDNKIIIADMGEKHDAFAAATLALSKSGTISLELAAADVPTVVAHAANPVSVWLIRRVLLIPHGSLVNIATKREVMPELIQERCTAANIVKELRALSSPAAQEKQRAGYAEALATLRGANPRSPNEAAAEAVLKFVRA